MIDRRRERIPAAPDAPAPEGGDAPQPRLAPEMTAIVEAAPARSADDGRSGISRVNRHREAAYGSQPLTANPTATGFEEQYAAKAFEFDLALRLKFKGLLSDLDREELYQEAWAEFLAMLEKGGRVETRADAVVYRIGERRAIDLLKKRDRAKARVSSVDDSILSLIADDAYGIDEQVEIRDEWRRCRQLIESALNERERQVFGLRYILGVPPAEVHGRFGVSPKRLEKIVGKAFKKIAAARGLVENGAWTERQLELLVRCEAGTASPEERELARKLAAEDPKVRGMLRDLRGAAALFPMPVLAHHATGLLGLAANAAAAAKHRALDVLARLAERGAGTRLGGGVATGALPLGGKAAAVVATACVATGAGYCAVAGLPVPQKHPHHHVARLAGIPSAAHPTELAIAYRPERHSLQRPLPSRRPRRKRHKAPTTARTVPPPEAAPAPQPAAPVAPTAGRPPPPAPASGTGEFGP